MKFAPGLDDNDSEAELNPLDLAPATDSDEGDGTASCSDQHCHVLQIQALSLLQPGRVCTCVPRVASAVSPV